MAEICNKRATKSSLQPPWSPCTYVSLFSSILDVLNVLNWLSGKGKRRDGEAERGVRGAARDRRRPGRAQGPEAARRSRVQPRDAGMILDIVVKFHSNENRFHYKGLASSLSVLAGWFEKQKFSSVGDAVNLFSVNLTHHS